jgi:nucleoside-diphosphate-sugar epimerase
VKVLITGINGFLGSQLAHRLASSNCEVSGSMRIGSTIPDDVAACASVRHHALGEPVAEELFAGVESVVHCAHDFRPGRANLNIRGTHALVHAAREAGAEHQIYLSSYSARADTPVEYGKTKYELERFFLSAGLTIVRPGLVIGAGGLFGGNLKRMLTSRVIPLLDGGRDTLPLLAIDDFIAAIECLVKSRQKGTFNLFGEELVSMRTLIELVQHKAGRRVLYVPISTGLAVWGLDVLDKLRIRLPVDVDNLRALKLNQAPIHSPNLRKLLARETSLDEMLDRALEGAMTRPI